MLVLFPKPVGRKIVQALEEGVFALEVFERGEQPGPHALHRHGDVPQFVVILADDRRMQIFPGDALGGGGEAAQRGDDAPAQDNEDKGQRQNEQYTGLKQLLPRLLLLGLKIRRQ